MNFRRGAFRLWLLGSVLWVIGVAASSFAHVAEEFRLAETHKQWPGEPALSVDCRLARGQIGTDYTKEEDGPWMQYRPDPQRRFCTYRESRYRTLFHEDFQLSLEDIQKKLDTARGFHTPRMPKPWTELAIATAYATVPPLSILVIGAALAWAFAGFRPGGTRLMR